MGESIKVQKIGRYILQEKLGEGSMGSVWLSFHTGLNLPVAIKLLNMDLANEDQEYLTRFMQEGRLAGQLNHKNIVRIYDAGTEGNHAFIVMEYIEGCDTLELLEARGALPPDEVLGLAIGVAEALQEAHSLGIIHRDIKPDNILATNEGRIKLADLGLAKQINDDFGSTMAGVALGTPYYIAPEQALDAMKADARSDIYSFGATLYHLLSGFLPYEGDNVMGVMLRHTNEELVPPQEKCPGLPESFCRVICKMMEKDPDDRYQSCAELLEDLNKLRYGSSDVGGSNDLMYQSEAELKSNLAAGKSIRVKMKVAGKGKYSHSKKSSSSSGRRPARKVNKGKKKKNNSALFISCGFIALILLFLIPVLLGGSKSSPEETNATQETKTSAVSEEVKASKSEEPLQIIEPSSFNLMEDDGTKYFIKTSDSFKFEDGKLLIDSTNLKPYSKGTMPTKERYSKFKLTAEFMFLESPSDSGIHFHAHDSQFLEVQLCQEGSPKTGSFLTRGGAYFIENEQKLFLSTMQGEPQRGLNEWNTLTMTVVENSITYNLNGVEKTVNNLSSSEGYIRMSFWNKCKLVYRKLELEKLD